MRWRRSCRAQEARQTTYVSTSVPLSRRRLFLASTFVSEANGKTTIRKRSKELLDVVCGLTSGNRLHGGTDRRLPLANVSERNWC